MLPFMLKQREDLPPVMPGDAKRAERHYAAMQAFGPRPVVAIGHPFGGVGVVVHHEHELRECQRCDTFYPRSELKHGYCPSCQATKAAEARRRKEKEESKAATDKDAWLRAMADVMSDAVVAAVKKDRADCPSSGGSSSSSPSGARFCSGCGGARDGTNPYCSGCGKRF